MYIVTMGYKRRQKDLERKQRLRNPYARSLSNTKYRQRIIKNKKKKPSKYKFNLSNAFELDDKEN